MGVEYMQVVLDNLNERFHKLHIFNASSNILGQSDERVLQYVGKMVGNFNFKIQINRSCKCCKHGIITLSLWKF
jgi:hypothetical protein